jgi:hypothetical protein
MLAFYRTERSSRKENFAWLRSLLKFFVSAETSLRYDGVEVYPWRS